MKSIKTYWDEWILSIAESNDQAFKDTIASLGEQLEAEKVLNDELIADSEECDKIIEDLEIECLDLESDLSITKKLLEEAMAKVKAGENELEEYWNTKIQSVNLKYNARGKPMDVRKFLTERNDKVISFKTGTYDQRATKCLDWVAKNITYTRDKDMHNRSEFWQYANETMLTRKGDCEDGAILIANMMLASGIPYWRVRPNAGDVKGGGHCYVTYLREKDNVWYMMDWCYWYYSSKDFKKTWQDAKNYFGIWFSWNTKYIFAKATLDRK